MSAINKLPVELLTYIFLFAKKPVEECLNPFLSYTWVCRHWRSILIQNPAFWTHIYRSRWHSNDDFVDTFRNELLRRSGSAELDVILPNDFTPFTPWFKNLFVKEGNRIRNLVVGTIDHNSFHYIISVKCLVSLRGLSLLNGYDHPRFLPELVASHQLETLELQGYENIKIPLDQIALIFGRIRNLKLTVRTVNSSVRAVLNSGVKLEKLRLNILGDSLASGQEETVMLLPELQFLSINNPTIFKYLRTPKIESLDARWGFLGLDSFDYQIFKDLDFLSIQYLYTCTSMTSDGHIISGSKNSNHCASDLFSQSIISGLDFLTEDGFRKHSRNCFRFRFRDKGAFAIALPWILSRLKNLIQLHLLHPAIHFRPQTPITLPELQVLSIENSSPLIEYLCVPKISSLNVKWKLNTRPPTDRTWDKFDFSSIKHLYIRRSDDLEHEHEHGNYCILGSPRPFNDCEPFHLVIKDLPSKPYGEFPRDCFHFAFQSKNTLARALRECEMASLVSPQLMNAVELDLLFPCTMDDLRAIITLSPLVEKVIVRHGSKLLDFIRFLNNTSVLPRMKYLYFATFLIPQNLEKYAEDVGESLTTCLKYRREDPAHVESELKYIVLRNCPPLPAIWLDELQKLGVTEIITETEAKKGFTSLRGLSLRNNHDGNDYLLSALVASDQLETLELESCEDINIPRDEIARIFGRIRSLRLTVSTVTSSVRAVLSSSVKLEKLRLKICLYSPASGHEETVILLPELQFVSIAYPRRVLEYLHIPKITSLDLRWGVSGYFDYQILKEFSFLPIKYLYARGHPSSRLFYYNPQKHDYCILGSKEPIHPGSLFSESTISSTEFLIEDGFREYSRDCFHFKFGSETTFATALSSILSRLKNGNLIEFHLLDYHTIHTPTNDPWVTFPELQLLSIESSSLLLEYLRAPKLSSLNVKWTPNTRISICQIWNEFNFSSIKHLYIRCSKDRKGVREHRNYCILGSKTPVNECKPFHLGQFDVPSKRPGESPRDCLHFTFQSRNTFVGALREHKISSLVSPQLTNLIELDLLFPCTLNNLRAIIALTPLVEKVIIRHGSKLLEFIRFLNNTSVLPRMRHLYFATFLIPPNLEEYAEDIGESLTTCLKYRREASSSSHVESELKRIILRNCPPLPSIWLEELQKLGVTEIVTETEAKIACPIGGTLIAEGDSYEGEMKQTEDIPSQATPVIQNSIQELQEEVAKAFSFLKPTFDNFDTGDFISEDYMEDEDHVFTEMNEGPPEDICMQSAFDQVCLPSDIFLKASQSKRSTYEGEWAPYPSHAINLLFNSPHLHFSTAEKKAILKYTADLGETDVPTLTTFKALRSKLADQLGRPTVEKVTRAGDIYFLNNIQSALAKVGDDIIDQEFHPDHLLPSPSPTYSSEDETEYDSPYPIPKDSDFPPILYPTQPSYYLFQTELQLYIDLREKFNIRISPTTTWPAPTPMKTYHKDLEDLEIIETLHYTRPIVIQGFQGAFVIRNSYSLKKHCPYTPVGITRVITHQKYGPQFIHVAFNVPSTAFWTFSDMEDYPPKTNLAVGALRDLYN
ncbi:hypothetical protein Clacol_002305 [Clathrus columnatus]|uniref:F-box domain-containing protein n=1 Tax=Clathrus columnatus TaxID=1419009 RepID=A0AAV5A3S8_9AGAM|nr:hypothetical protein Clacol_002305 [Clathrus columnatus]